LISCKENPKIFTEVLDELERFIYKKVSFDEISVRRLPSVSKFCNPHNFFPYNLDTSPFESYCFSGSRGKFRQVALHTNIWLLYTFKERNILFYGKIFFLIRRFGVSVIFLGFWVEPANSIA
jgi:hypothetical protein